MRNIALFSLLVSLSACNSVDKALPPASADLHPVKLSPSQLEAVKKGVARDMKDPESVRLNEVLLAAEDGGTIHVCGYVNAKNSYGGYVGEKPFYAMGTKTANVFTSMMVGDDAAGATIARQACAKYGMTL
jgi:hypothetical protein